MKAVAIAGLCIASLVSGAAVGPAWDDNGDSTSAQPSSLQTADTSEMTAAPSATQDAAPSVITTAPTGPHPQQKIDQQVWCMSAPELSNVPGQVPFTDLPPEIQSQLPPPQKPVDADEALGCLREHSNKDETGTWFCDNRQYTILLEHWTSVDMCVVACTDCVTDSLQRGMSVVGCRAKKGFAHCLLAVNGGEMLALEGGE